MATGFTVAQVGNYKADIDDILIRREYFSDGNLWCWGNNGYGQLGDNTTAPKSSPIQTIASGTNWSRIRAVGNATAAIKTDGTLWLWGRNDYGQLGNNTTTFTSSPVQTVAGGDNWVQVASSDNHISGIKSDGTLWSWGMNTSGQLGDNTVVSKSSPVQVYGGGNNWLRVAGHYNTTAAIKTDGSLWLWGANGYSVVNYTNPYNLSSPIQTTAGGNNWKMVDLGANFAAAVKTDGTLWTWGWNINGQIGDGTTIDRTTGPIQPITGSTNWNYVACGRYFTVAIKTDGTLWSWGQNTYGALGDNSVVSRSSPVQTVAGGTNWKSVAAGWFHTAAIKTDGTLWSWGQNTYGALGDNSVVSRSSPVQTVAGGTNWKSVRCSNVHTVALTDLTF